MTEKNMNIEHRLNDDGSINPKYIDLLDEDKPISGQNLLVYLLSPEYIIKDKIYIILMNLQTMGMTKAFEKYSQFLNFISYKYNIEYQDLVTDLNDFAKDQKNVLSNTSIEDDFKSFMDKNEEKLDEEFSRLHNFKTSVRGIKIRGVFLIKQKQITM